MNRENRSTAKLASVFGAAALLASLTLTGCKDEVVTPTVTAPQKITITIKANAIQFSDTNLKVGKTIFTIMNADTITHNFEIEEESTASEKFHKPINAGATAISDTIMVTAGTWEFYDPENKDKGIDHDLVAK